LRSVSEIKTLQTFFYALDKTQAALATPGIPGRDRSKWRSLFMKGVVKFGRNVYVACLQVT